MLSRILRNKLEKFILLLSNFENDSTVPLDKLLVQFSSGKLTVCCVFFRPPLKRKNLVWTYHPHRDTNKTIMSNMMLCWPFKTNSTKSRSWRLDLLFKGEGGGGGMTDFVSRLVKGILGKFAKSFDFKVIKIYII